jgi:hypothetical protein
MVKDSITSALGIEDTWFLENFELLEKALNDSDTVSDAMEQVANQIKVDEFGEGDYQLSLYEKKLILAGLQMGDVLAKAREKQAMESVIHALLQGRSGRP